MYEVSSNNGGQAQRSRELCCVFFAGVVVLAVGIIGGILIGIYAYHGGPSGNDFKVECVIPPSSDTDEQKQPTTAPDQTTTANVGNQPDCVYKKRDPFIPTSGPQLFAPLTDAEMHTVRQFLIDKGIVSDVPGSEIGFTTNYITSMDVYIPPKRDVLAHIYHGAKFPGRHAVATVNRGAAVPPDIMDYVVGPLENSSNLSYTAVTEAGENAFTVRAIDGWEVYIVMIVVSQVNSILAPLVAESFDGVVFGDPDFEWLPYNGAPGATQDLRELTVTARFKPTKSVFYYIDLLPLSFHINTTSQNPYEWRMYDFHYLNQGPYGSAQELLDDYNAGNIRKVKLPPGYRNTIEKRLSVGRDVTRPLRPFGDAPAPRTFETEGPRYSIQGHRVSWMGWSFDVTSRMLRGPAIFDINFQNERIAYEVALNEAFLQYSSDSFSRSNMFFTDATYGIGLFGDLINSVDCPEHGTLLKTSHYNAFHGNASVSKSICVFESDTEGPLWRHTPEAYTAGMRDTHLVVRFSSLIGNYDYITEFHFMLDGRLETKISASGYIQTDFWDKENPNHGNETTDDSYTARDAFGYRVTDHGHGIIHDHMFGFKVDMDIIDTNNSLEVIHIKFGSVADAFKKMNPSLTQKPEYFRYNTTRYVEYETVQQEIGYKYNLMTPNIWMIVNENYRNKWGAKRGYAIVPGCTAVQTLKAPHPPLAAASFSEYTCAVTKQKDTELFINSVYDGFRLDNPKGPLSQKIDGEHIVNEDLVSWVTVGFLHVPSSEDIPMTLGAHTGFTLKPFNFFDRTEIYDMPQNYDGSFGVNEKPTAFEPTCFKSME